jgi:hypothetical protein
MDEQPNVNNIVESVESVPETTTDALDTPVETPDTVTEPSVDLSASN